MPAPALLALLARLGVTEGAAASAASGTGAEIAAVGENATKLQGMMGSSFGVIAEQTNKMAAAIENFGDKFSIMTGKITSTKQIPGVEELTMALTAVNPILGLVTKAGLAAVDAIAKIQQAIIDVKLESIKTGAAFGLSSREISQYASRQAALFGELQMSLRASQEDFDKYQKFLSTSAFRLGDLSTPIDTWGKRASATEKLFAVSKGLNLELEQVLRDTEDATTKMSKGKTMEESLSGVLKMYHMIYETAIQLDHVSIPYIKQELFKAISGQYAAIDSFDDKMVELNKTFKAFFVGLGPGQQGLAGEFLEEVNKGFMSMSIGMSAWLATKSSNPAEVGTLSEALDLMMSFRNKGDIVETTKQFVSKMQGMIGVEVNSWDGLQKELGKDASFAAAGHVAQMTMLQKQFKFANIMEAETFASLAHKMMQPGFDQNSADGKETAEKIGDIIKGAGNVAKKQLNYLDNIHTFVRGMFFKLVWGDTKGVQAVDKALGSREDRERLVTQTLDERDKRMNVEKATKEKRDREKNQKAVLDKDELAAANVVTPEQMETRKGIDIPTIAAQASGNVMSNPAAPGLPKAQVQDLFKDEVDKGGRRVSQPYIGAESGGGWTSISPTAPITVAMSGATIPDFGTNPTLPGESTTGPRGEREFIARRRAIETAAGLSERELTDEDRRDIAGAKTLALAEFQVRNHSVQVPILGAQINTENIKAFDMVGIGKSLQRGDVSRFGNVEMDKNRDLYVVFTDDGKRVAVADLKSIFADDYISVTRDMRLWNEEMQTKLGAAKKESQAVEKQAEKQAEEDRSSTKANGQYRFQGDRGSTANKLAYLDPFEFDVSPRLGKELNMFGGPMGALLTAMTQSPQPSQQLPQMGSVKLSSTVTRAASSAKNIKSLFDLMSNVMAGQQATKLGMPRDENSSKVYDLMRNFKLSRLEAADLYARVSSAKGSKKADEIKSTAVEAIIGESALSTLSGQRDQKDNLMLYGIQPVLGEQRRQRDILSAARPLFPPDVGGREISPTQLQGVPRQQEARLAQPRFQTPAANVLPGQAMPVRPVMDLPARSGAMSADLGRVDRPAAESRDVADLLPQPAKMDKQPVFIKPNVTSNVEILPISVVMSMPPPTPEYKSEHNDTAFRG